jgi:hypothetical protein
VVANPPTYPEHLGFILAEEDALKTYLENTVTLPTRSGEEQSVRVWFRYPDPEHQTLYPYITIDLIGIEPAYDLWMSEFRYYLQSEVEEDSNTGVVTGHRLYDPSTSKDIVNPQPTNFFWRRNYLQYRLYYQLALWNNQAVLDRILSARMFRDIIMPHPSWLYCDADGTWKRMETLGWTAADLPSQEGASKRIFRKLYTISIQTDIPQDRLTQLTLNPEVQKVLLRMYELGTGDPSSTTDPPDWLTPDASTDYWEQIQP